MYVCMYVCMYVYLGVDDNVLVQVDVSDEFVVMEVRDSS